jgi:phosphinothricin acetyltransferase
MIRDAALSDLPGIVEIYNSTIESRESTADTEPVTVAGRRGWYAAHVPSRRPLWVFAEGRDVLGWLSFKDFYGRPAYAQTAEIGVYVREDARRRGIARALLRHAVAESPRLEISALIAVVFSHNLGSRTLFKAHGFEEWGRLPGVARLDGQPADVLMLGRHVAG